VLHTGGAQGRGHLGEARLHGLQAVAEARQADARQLERDGIAVGAPHPGALHLEDGLGMATAAEGDVEVGASRARGERSEGLRPQHGDVRVLAVTRRWRGAAHADDVEDIHFVTLLATANFPEIDEGGA
jgi:hypothetical protein